MDVARADEAAAKIQAGFRGYQVRKRMQRQKKRQQQPNDGRSGEVVVNDEEDEGDNATADARSESKTKEPPTLEDKSAAKIQAGVRGYLVRKRQQAEKAAATKIQAGFRGFRTRKLLKQSGQ